MIIIDFKNNRMLEDARDLSIDYLERFAEAINIDTEIIP